jgi:glycyl-tRNA synthetase beta subunit
LFDLIRNNLKLDIIHNSNSFVLLVLEINNIKWSISSSQQQNFISETNNINFVLMVRYHNNNKREMLLNNISSSCIRQSNLCQDSNFVGSQTNFDRTISSLICWQFESKWFDLKYFWIKIERIYYVLFYESNTNYEFFLQPRYN